MLDITIDQVNAARANNLDAVTAVLAATEDRITCHARNYATSGGHTDRELMDDLAQVGRIAVWEAIGRFAGESVDQFAVFLDTTIRGALTNERRAQTRQGVSEAASRRFEHALTMAGGDPYEAERLAQDVQLMGGHGYLSADLALAARVSWQGAASLDMQVDNGSSGDYRSLADTIADPASVPDDLMTDTDRERNRQREIRGFVHSALGKLGTKARSILHGTYGIDGDTPYFGTDHEEDFAAFLGMVRTSDLRSARAKAKGRFRDVYLAGAQAPAA